MAQDPEEEARGSDALDTSHDLDMVTIYDSSAVDAEAEADVICGLLNSNGIPAAIVRGAMYPSLGDVVQVPRAMVEEAERLIAEALATGPEGAAEAEASSEEGQ
jgi:hypothetical protein